MGFGDLPKSERASELEKSRVSSRNTVASHRHVASDSE